MQSVGGHSFAAIDDIEDRGSFIVVQPRKIRISVAEIAPLPSDELV
jgi:hypothetical protein